MTNSNPKRWTDFDPYLSPDDLGGKATVLTVSAVESVDVYDQREKQTVSKPVLRFRGQRKYLILSPINRKALLKIHGNEISACIGKPVSLRVEKVKAFGEEKRVLRIAAAPAQKVDTSTGEVLDEPPADAPNSHPSGAPAPDHIAPAANAQPAPIRDPRQLLAYLQARGGEWVDLNDLLTSCRELIPGFRTFPMQGDVKSYQAIADKLTSPSTPLPAPSGK